MNTSSNGLFGYSLVKSQQELKFIEQRVEIYNDFIKGQQLQKQYT
jgi:hypothetical protein